MIVNLVADVHAHNMTVHPGQMAGGLNDRCRLILEVLARAAEGCECLIVAGDLLDSSGSSPQVIRAVGDVLSKVKYCVLIRGNHEVCSLTSGDNSLAPFGLMPNVSVIEDVREILSGVWAVPYPYDYRDVPISALSQGAVVIAHHGIRDDSVAAWARDKGVPVDQILEWMDKHGVGHYLSGDWHPRKVWAGGRVQQIGALCPVDWRNPGIDGYGSVLSWDQSKSVGMVPGTSAIGRDVRLSVLPGPRFIHSNDPKDLAVRGATRLYVRASYPVDGLDIPPHVIVEAASVAVTAEGEARKVSDHVTASRSVETEFDACVELDTLIPDDMKPEVARRGRQLLMQT